MAKQRQQRMQYQVGTLGAIQQLEDRTDEQLRSESKHRAAARAILGARAAEKYDVKQARVYFNEALAACNPRERQALRQLMKASIAQAERKPDELKEAMEKLGQAPPSSRQLFILRLMGLIAPPESAGRLQRIRGFALLLTIVFVLMALGFGVAKLVALPFGGVGTLAAILIGVAIIVIALGILTLLGRRRQAKAKTKQREQAAAQSGRRR
ncbi:MAG: hypothetical protein QOG63_289 [Thermoleophilaceae bacterium]|jgi:hypothetical protein|nr:hypothetical protein [Thermoleophilaceae bacterium]